jgi:hypothetical protein
MKTSFEFKKDFETGKIILEMLGRLTLASGNQARILLTPDGIKLFIDKSSKENGDIVFSKHDDHINLSLKDLA